MDSFFNRDNGNDSRGGDGAGPRPGKGIKNIYARGADDGAWVGLYMIVLMGLMVAGMHVALAGLLTWVMVLGMPLLVYHLLKRTNVAAHGMCLFSALWMQGIIMFACGSVLLGVVAFVYLKWFNPDYLKGVLAMVAEQYAGSPQESWRMFAEESALILKRGLLPAASQVVMSLMWLVVFSGSLLSMACAMFVKVIAHIRSFRK